MVSIEVDPKFCGPTIMELAPVLDRITDDPLRVKWGGTKAETRLLEAHGARRFVVCVTSYIEANTVAGTFGTPLQLEAKTLNSGMTALASRKGYDWKNFIAETGQPTARSLLVKIAADSVRQGLQPKLANVAADVLLGKANPLDADVLLRLRTAQQG